MIYSINPTAATYAGGMKAGAAGTAAGNKAALQAALNSGKSVAIPSGSYFIEPGLTFFTNGQRIYGQGPRQTILIIQGNGNLFSSNGKHDVGLQSFQVNGDPAATSGFVMVYDGGSSIVTGGICSDLIISGAWNGFGVYATNNTTIENIKMMAMRGDAGIHSTCSNPALRVDIIIINNVVYSVNSSIKSIRGIGLYADGFVHTITINGFKIVGPNRGLYISNSPGLPVGQRPSFIFANQLEIDFPWNDAVFIDSGDRHRIVNSYIHGSVNESGIIFGTGVRNAAVVATNVTGHAKSGIYFDGLDLDLTAVQLDWNSQAGYGVHHGILLGNNANQVRIVGGGARDTQVSYGILRSNPASSVQVSAVDDHWGVNGVKNF